MIKRDPRIRRALKTRKKIAELGKHRLSVYRTPRHIYAQVFDASGSKVFCSASSLAADVKNSVDGKGKVAMATAVGRNIAEKAKQAGIETLAFDRSGFRYHGRIKALAEAAREAGLKF